MIKVYSAANITEAHIVKGMLEANGVEAFVDGFYLQGGIGELVATDFVFVSVNAGQQQEARELIEEYENNRITPDNE